MVRGGRTSRMSRPSASTAIATTAGPWRGRSTAIGSRSSTAWPSAASGATGRASNTWRPAATGAGRGRWITRSSTPAASSRRCGRPSANSATSGRDARPAPGPPDNDFRPGLPLQDILTVFVRAGGASRQQGGQPRGADARQPLLPRVPAARLGCISCHDPHVHVVQAEQRVAHYRESCLACHAEPGCSLPHSERLRTSPQDSCIDCHMPRQRPGQHPPHRLHGPPHPPHPAQRGGTGIGGRSRRSHNSRAALSRAGRCAAQAGS